MHLLRRCERPQGGRGSNEDGDGNATGEEPAPLIVEQGERCFTMLNAFPYASGHLMVAPYRHVGELGQLDDNEVLDLMRLAQHGLGGLRQVMEPDGFNLGLNLGAVAGAGIAGHLHLHVVPRWEGDTNFMPVIADTRVIPRALKDTARYSRPLYARTGDDAQWARARWPGSVARIPPLRPRPHLPSRLGREP